MNCVEIIKQTLKDRKIPFSRIEKDLGFGNGYIAQLKGDSIRQDRLEMIADYLGLEVSYFTGRKEKTAPIIESGELNRKKIFAEMLSCIPERDRIVIEHNILMLWRLAKEEGTLKPCDAVIDLEYIIERLTERRDILLGGNA